MPFPYVFCTVRALYLIYFLKPFWNFVKIFLVEIQSKFLYSFRLEMWFMWITLWITLWFLNKFWNSEKYSRYIFTLLPLKFGTSAHAQLSIILVYIIPWYQLETYIEDNIAEIGSINDIKNFVSWIFLETPSGAQFLTWNATCRINFKVEIWM